MKSQPISINPFRTRVMGTDKDPVDGTVKEDTNHKDAESPKIENGPPSPGHPPEETNGGHIESAKRKEEKVETEKEKTSSGKPVGEKGVEHFGNGTDKAVEKTKRNGSSPRKSDMKADLGEDGREEESSSFEVLLKMVGKSGPWNYMIFISICMCSLASPFQNLSYQFLGFTPDYWCYVEPLIAANWTTEQILEVAIPKKEDGSPEGCIRYDYDFERAAALGYDAVKDNLELISDGTNRTMSCQRRDFNYTQYASTIVTEWDLVCERRYLYSSTQAAAQAGKLIGCLGIGYFSDTFGRRYVVLISSLLYIITGFLASSSITIGLYIFCRILISLFGVGFYMPCFVLALEFCTPSQRSYVGSFFTIPWAIGYMAIPGIAYYVREWKPLQAALTAPSLVLLIYFWMLPESPRWLVLKGRFKEALDVLKKAAAMNSRVLPSDDEMFSIMKSIKDKDAPEEEAEEGKKSWLDVVKSAANLFFQLFNTTRIAIQTLIVFFCWFSVSFVYYGVALNSFNIGADTYWYTFFSGLLEVPSYLLLWPATALAGRKKTLIGLYALCAAAIFGSVGASESIGWAATLSLTGKFAITAAFQVAYLFTAELYQTGTRTVAISTSSVMARCGSIITPYINDLIGESNPLVPSIMFGTVSCIAAVTVFFLSETNKQNLSETVTGAEIAFKKKSSSRNPIVESSGENLTSIEPSAATQAK